MAKVPSPLPFLPHIHPGLPGCPGLCHPKSLNTTGVRHPPCFLTCSTATPRSSTSPPTDISPTSPGSAPLPFTDNPSSLNPLGHLAHIHYTHSAAHISHSLFAASSSRSSSACTSGAFFWAQKRCLSLRVRQPNSLLITNPKNPPSPRHKVPFSLAWFGRAWQYCPTVRFN